MTLTEAVWADDWEAAALRITRAVKIAFNIPVSPFGPNIPLRDLVCKTAVERY